MSQKERTVAIGARDIPPRSLPSHYPESVASCVKGREKRPLGDFFGLQNFGVNLTQLAPGAISALRHAHARQDEFIHILEGHPILRTHAGETILSSGMCAGFPAGTGDAHQLINSTGEIVRYLEIGDRSPDDSVTYPDDDMKADWVEGRWQFAHKDGTPY